MGKDLDVDYAKRLRETLDGPPRVDMLEAIRTATVAQKGNSWVNELWRANRGPGKLAYSEYFYYRLYGTRGPTDLSRYVGKAAQSRMHRACNNPHWFAVCHDKPLFYTVAQGAGLPIPETVASFDARGRHGLGQKLRTRDELLRFLDDPQNYPVFAKPSDGMYSVGALHMLSADDGRIRLKGGDSATIEDVADFIEQLTSDGYLFQRVRSPHPARAASFGNALASVRLLVLWRANGLEVESAVVKIPLPSNVADNYWRSGNMLGALDRDTGVIQRVVTGTEQALREVDTHPETGVPLRGVRLPDWEAAIATCLKGASLFPGIRTQSWDVALSADGPLLLEFNFGGDFNLHQLAHGRGILSPALAAHLRECGYKGKLP
jgi:hypothetical protein